MAETVAVCLILALVLTNMDARILPSIAKQCCFCIADRKFESSRHVRPSVQVPMQKQCGLHLEAFVFSGHSQRDCGSSLALEHPEDLDLLSAAHVDPSDVCDQVPNHDLARPTVCDT